MWAVQSIATPIALNIRPNMGQASNGKRNANRYTSKNTAFVTNLESE
jgi:hypothetical protein